MTEPAIRVRHLRAFGQEGASLNEIKTLNLIVGRNNAGKSSLLDAVEVLADPKAQFENQQRHQGQPPTVELRSELPESWAKAIFSKGSSGGYIPGNHWNFYQSDIGGRLELQWMIRSGSRKLLSTVPDLAGFPGLGVEQITSNIAARLDTLQLPLDGRVVKRLRSDRDIRPEDDNPAPTVDGAGAGATRLIRDFLNKASMPREIVTRDILQGLNTVFGPDTHFEEIEVQLRDDGDWEVYLGEEAKGLIPLSMSGSGIKTALLVLIYLHAIPHLEGRKLAQYVFLFEELENNLHPALQRRLFQYIFDTCVAQGSTAFISTHSSVIIDQFSRNSDTQIIHVRHDGTAATATAVATHIERDGILDDLDVRASDLLQANGIVWVEGPSDRLFFNRWIELETQGALSEGTHYQCVFYGGRLLSHFSAADPDDVDGYLAMLRINRNALLIGDGDKRSSSTHLNATKRRLRDEVAGLAAGHSWFTRARTIEHYLPTAAIESAFGVRLGRPPETYEDFGDYLEEVAPSIRRRFDRKADFAAEVLPHIDSAEAVKTLHELGEELPRAIRLIKAWNGLD